MSKGPKVAFCSHPIRLKWLITHPTRATYSNVGKVDPKRHLEQHVSDLMSANIVQSLGTMLSTVVF